MKLHALLYSCLAVACTAIDPSKYSPTPAGWVLSHCVHEVRSDALVTELASGDTLVRHSEEDDRIIPRCDNLNGTHPTLLPKQFFSKPSLSSSDLPPDYDGWLQYTAYHDPEGFDSFVGEMSVPDVPKETPQILYLFPGLQNIDWIPKVDPEPTSSNPFDIIQPVLQYPAGFFSKKWGVRSWYVTVNAGALQSKLLLVESGDAILCNMTRTGPSSWFVGSTIKSSGKSTNQNADNARLKAQPWAYNTVECYGCSGCGTYPQKPVEFSKLQLSKKGVSTSPKWLVNPKKPVKELCHEATVVTGPSDVSMSFQQDNSGVIV